MGIWTVIVALVIVGFIVSSPFLLSSKTIDKIAEFLTGEKKP